MASEEEFTNDFIFKICVIGDPAVGKTSLIKQFTQGTFNKDYIKTLGAQFSRYERIFSTNSQKIRARLFFWDIAGQAEFKFMRPTFYNGAKGLLVVYDVSRPETLETVNTWIDDISNYCGPLPGYIFANKSDLIDESSYDQSKAAQLAKDRGLLGMYLTSAKTGKLVQDAFNAIIDVLVKNTIKEV